MSFVVALRQLLPRRGYSVANRILRHAGGAGGGGGGGNGQLRIAAPHPRSSIGGLPRRPLGQTRQFYKSSAEETGQDAHSTSIFNPLDTFQRRHVGPSPSETQKMLDHLKCDSLDSFVRDVVPPNILSSRDLKVAPTNGLSETELLMRLGEIAAQNKKTRSYIGCGYVGTKTPTVIARNILECPEWYTSYTPYQPEISQGTPPLLPLPIQFQLHPRSRVAYSRRTIATQAASSLCSTFKPLSPTLPGWQSPMPPFWTKPRLPEKP